MGVENDSWATKFPWVESIKSLMAIFSWCVTRFAPQLNIRKLLVPNLNGLKTHSGKKMCKVVQPNIMV
jgi:hypothetical protein